MSRTYPPTAGSRTAGFADIRRLFMIIAVISVGAVLFFIMDLRHRAEGYQTANGGGVRGVATMTGCEHYQTADFCTGDFVSGDGGIRRTGIRINGAAEILNWDAAGDERPPPPGTKVRAAVSGPDADEAWALDGTPWLHFSMLHVLLLLPVLLTATTARRVMRGGVAGWRWRRFRWQRRRLRRDRRQLRHDQQRVRRGHAGGRG